MESSVEKSFRSGFVAVMGKPNVGKSTLINRLLGQKIAAVSPRPQTTRKRQLGILTSDVAQVIFIDTPGIHHPRHKLGEAMNQQAREVLEDADLVLFIMDVSQPVQAEDSTIAGLLLAAGYQSLTLMVLNKIDLLSKDLLMERQMAFQSLLPEARVLPVSATRGDNCQVLLDEILAKMPKGPLYYPQEQITDLHEREIASDLIREAALIHLRDEIPHGIAVRLDEYKDRDEQTAYIAATLLLERESHKPIVIGRNGSMLKKIGTSARKEIEAMTGRKIYLELRVKVNKDWRDDEDSLRKLGFTQEN